MFREATEKVGGQVKMARFLGVSQTAVCQWCAGERKPGADNRDVIEAKTNPSILARYWRIPADEEQAMRGRRAA